MKKITIKTIIYFFTTLFFYSSIAYSQTPAEWVNAHNKYRRRHLETPDVKWSNKLANSAQQWANTCPQEHSGPGENITWGSPNAEYVVKGWYEEIEDYDYNNPGFSEETGHFTQVVWKGSTEIGCGVNTNGCNVWVCQYSPPGNTIGWFPDNVKPLKNIMWGNILWHHDSGLVAAWYMNGASFEGAAWIGFAPIDWKIVGTGHFDTDDQTDILWRNTKTGKNVVWVMDGAISTSSKSIKNENDLNWKIVGTGDFDGDSRTDILWRNETTGQTLIWLMDLVKYVKSVSLPWSTNPYWEVVGTGDFNDDYQTDVLWRHTITGETLVWYIREAKYIYWDWVPSAGPDWEIGATGDLNDDGQTDIIWRNPTTGVNWIVYMVGHNYLSIEALPPLDPINGFKMVGTGKFE